MSVIGTPVTGAPYCTKEDVEARFHPENVLAWADDDGSGDLNESEEEIVADAIRRASTQIDARLTGLYEVPFADPVPWLVRDVAADLAGCALFTRRGLDEGTSAEVGRAALARLEDIARGRLALDAVDRLERTIEVTRG